MGYDDIVGDILHNHHAYHATHLASDFGVGAVYNSKLREKILPEQHLVFNYVGPTADWVFTFRKLFCQRWSPQSCSRRRAETHSFKWAKGRARPATLLQPERKLRRLAV
jgi:hypothetical protein